MHPGTHGRVLLTETMLRSEPLQRCRQFVAGVSGSHAEMMGTSRCERVAPSGRALPGRVCSPYRAAVRSDEPRAREATMGRIFAMIALAIVSIYIGCAPPPDCTGRMCGPNGRGESCGTCPTGETCMSAMCRPTGCTAGSTRACTCPAGTAGGPGTQTCQTDETYDACATCPPCTCGSPRHECGLDTCGANVCGTCMSGFRCNGSGACEIEPTAQWVVTATTATISQRDCAGDTWDPFGGFPDPEVCVDSTVSTGIMYGAKHCTPPVSDVLTATWSTMNTFTLPASTLTAGMVVELADNEAPFGGGTAICRGPVPITEADFRAGRRVIACGNCPAGTVGAGTSPGSMTFTLAPR